jgi:hypothetical protein
MTERPETIAAFYARTAVDGRAVLVGVNDNPRVWLSPERRTRTGSTARFYLCFEVREGSRLFHGYEPVTALRGYMNGGY